MPRTIWSGVISFGLVTSPELRPISLVSFGHVPFYGDHRVVLCVRVEGVGLHPKSDRMQLRDKLLLPERPARQPLGTRQYRPIRRHLRHSNLQMVLFVPALLDLPVIDDDRIASLTPDESMTHVQTRSTRSYELPGAGCEDEASVATQEPRHGGECIEPSRRTLGMGERVAHAEDHIEGRGPIETSGQLIPADAQRAQRDTMLLRELMGPAHHRSARVCRHHVQAERSQTHRELPGATRAVENARFRGKPFD